MTDFVYFDLCFFERCNLGCIYFMQSNKEIVPHSSYKAVKTMVDQLLLQSIGAVFKIFGYSL